MKRFVITILLLTSLPLMQAPLLAAEDSWIRDAYQRSFTNEKIEDYQGAIKALAGVIDHYPKGYTVNLRIGWLYYLNGRYANSIKHYQGAVLAAPDAIEPLLSMLLPLMAQTDYTEAEQIVGRVLQADPGNYYGNLRLIGILRSTGRQKPAEQNARRMLVRYPTDTLFLDQLGATLQAQSLMAEAAKVYNALQTLDPNSPSAALFFKPHSSSEGADQ
ncbi:MAG: tetratricopeptide repeat protein [Sedimenticola sp.]